MAFRNKRFEKRSRRRKRRSAEQSGSNIFARPSVASRAKSGVIYGLLALAALFVFLFIFFNVFGGGSKVKLIKEHNSRFRQRKRKGIRIPNNRCRHSAADHRSGQQYRGIQGKRARPKGSGEG